MRITLLRVLGAHHAILSLILIGLMIASLPLGAYVVFGTQNDSDSNIDKIGMTLAGFRIALPVDTTIGYAFAIIWCLYVVMVGISIIGPRVRILRAIKNTVTERGNTSWLYDNHMIAIVSWFTILILASSLIDLTQTNLGVQITPPAYSNDLHRFYDATKAPIIEEIGFRVLLIGAPLAGIYIFHGKPLNALRSLLYPYRIHGAKSIKIAICLIIASSLFFGILHIVGNDSWSTGKVTQAAIAGVILGWAYYRHGLLVAILIHWATNYFVLSLLYFIAYITETTLRDASSHFAAIGFEILLIISGTVSAMYIILGRTNFLKTKSVL